VPAFTLRELARRGEVPHLRIGRALWFPRQHLVEWIDGRVSPVAIKA
jgi:hypothetical protein